MTPRGTLHADPGRERWVSGDSWWGRAGPLVVEWCV